MQGKKQNQSFKARLGAAGEHSVVAMLMQQGWDAFNANCTIKNYKSVDIICINGDVCNPATPWKPDVTFVQVKTSVQNNIPVGFTMKETLDIDYLKRKVMGPYVFVAATQQSDGQYSFRYFIIPRNKFIELVHEAHKHYVYEWIRQPKNGPLNDEKRTNGVILNAPAGLYVRWLEGKSDPAAKHHTAFHNPLDGVSCENAWENIWKD